MKYSNTNPQKLVAFSLIALFLSTVIAIIYREMNKNDVKSAPNKPRYESITKGNSCFYSLSSVDYYAGGMHYKIINSSNGGIYAVNVTLDSITAANLQK